MVTLPLVACFCRAAAASSVHASSCVEVQRWCIAERRQPFGERRQIDAGRRELGGERQHGGGVAELAAIVGAPALLIVGSLETLDRRGERRRRHGCDRRRERARHRAGPAPTGYRNCRAWPRDSSGDHRSPPGRRAPGRRARKPGPRHPCRSRAPPTPGCRGCRARCSSPDPAPHSRLALARSRKSVT